MITDIFEYCVSLMRVLAALTGFTYKELNALIFLIFQPGLLLIFFVLWRIEKHKNKVRLQ